MGLYQQHRFMTVNLSSQKCHNSDSPRAGTEEWKINWGCGLSGNSCRDRPLKRCLSYQHLPAEGEASQPVGTELAALPRVLCLVQADYQAGSADFPICTHSPEEGAPPQEAAKSSDSALGASDLEHPCALGSHLQPARLLEDSGKDAPEKP